MPFTRHIISARNALKAGLLLFVLVTPIWQLAAAPAKPAASAAPATPPPVKKELSQKAQDALPEISKMMGDDQGNHNYDGAINAINALLPQLVYDSYDMALLSYLKAQSIISKGDYMASIQPLETALSLSEKYGFFGKGDLDMLWMLAQLYASDASSEKNPALLQQKYAKALNALRRWISLTPKPNYQAYIYIASILVQQGKIDSKEPEKDMDKGLIKQAREAALSALTLTTKPTESTSAYQLLVAISQALGDYTMAGKYLELLVQTNPKRSDYWGMLLNSYLQLIDATPDGSFLRNQAYAMAVHTINRAQQNGFMLTPTDFYNKVVMYINSDQLEGAADLLETSLHGGKMDVAKYSNWELLATTYIHLDEIQKAIDTFREAQKYFPTDGNIDMQIGYLYFYNLHQNRPALEAMLAASKKEVPPKKAPVLYSTIAYIYLYLKEYELGVEAVDKSLEMDPKSQNAIGIRNALVDAIDERNRILNYGSGAKPDQPATGQTQEQQNQTQPQTQPAAAQPAQ